MRRTKLIAILLAALLMIGLFAACGNQAPEPTSEPTPEVEETPNAAPEPEEPEGGLEHVHVRVGTLRGVLGMGMTAMMHWTEDENYTFTLGGTPEEMTAGLLSGALDIAAVPVNVASTLYNVTEGEVKIIAIGAFGAFYILDTTGEIETIEDLRGRTIHSAGQGATPEFALAYILRGNDIDPQTDVNIEFHTENAELATLMVAGEVEIALLPQPFVTTVTNQNEDIHIALDLTEEWSAISPDSAMATSGVVVRTEFLEENGDLVRTFIQDLAASIDFVNTNIDEAAELMEYFDIIPAAVARRAIPMSNLIHISGAEMIPLINGFLTVLYEANPQSVGGSLPDDAFFFLG